MLVYALFQRYLKLGENNCSFLSKKYTTLNYFRDMKLYVLFLFLFFFSLLKKRWMESGRHIAVLFIAGFTFCVTFAFDLDLVF